MCCLFYADCADNAIFFNILLGSHNVRLDAVDEPTRVEVRSNQYTVHPEWGPLRIVNDVALIRLPAPIEFTRMILDHWQYEKLTLKFHI